MQHNTTAKEMEEFVQNKTESNELRALNQQLI